MVILTFVIIFILTILYNPSLDMTHDRTVLLWYGPWENRKYKKLFKI